MVAVGVLVVIVVAAAVLIHGCDSSDAQNALKNYSASVYKLISASDSQGTNLFSDLSSGELTSDSGGLQNKLDNILQSAGNELSQAKGLSVPSQMARAQTALVYVMQLRYDGIKKIAGSVQQAASKATSTDAVYDISLGTSELYSSDVIYKTFVATDIAKALNAASIPVGTGSGEQPINPGQFVSDLGWLQQTWIADKIGAPQSTTAANKNNDAPGLHGHSLNYVTVDGTELDAAATNTIPASDARTWVLNLTNGGDFDEYDVGCSVTISALKDSGSSSVAETTPGETTNCTVTLPTAPTAGTYSVTARIAKVPGETNLTNNVIKYTVTFN